VITVIPFWGVPSLIGLAIIALTIVMCVRFTDDIYVNLISLDLSLMYYIVNTFKFVENNEDGLSRPTEGQFCRTQSLNAAGGNERTHQGKLVDC
jgi:hypothetical protein